MPDLTDDQLTEEEIQRLEIALEAASDSEDCEVCIGTNKMRKLLAAASRERATRERMEAADGIGKALEHMISMHGYGDDDTVRQAIVKWRKARATGGAGEGKER